MSDSPGPAPPLEPPLASEEAAVPAVVRMSQLGSLLDELHKESSATGAAEPAVSPPAENRLAQVRLGIASSLYAALRYKHAGTAAHAMRVALTSSAWAVNMALVDETRDAIEVAALLHDLGVIGIPDQILLKPGPLDDAETLIVEQSRAASREILRSACAEPTILEIVENVGAWYDGSRDGHRLRGEQIPLGARMITVAEAFDSMTSDQAFRPAMPDERAMAELFEFAGTQFDPKLVKRFSDFYVDDLRQASQRVATRWLRSLDPEGANANWDPSVVAPDPSCSAAGRLFEGRLLDNMHDAVVFVDANLRVTQWNHGAERLTGIVAASVCGRSWSSSLLSTRSEKGEPLVDDDCPVASAIHSGVQSLRRLTIVDRSGQPVAVDAHSIPVVGEDGSTLGAVFLLHDASPETSLEKRCQNLYEKATKDPMTQVANRAEFDRVHEVFVNTHKQQQVPCSLIICDLDRFKQVNDTYGHQAGDDAIKGLAKLLKSSCRAGDLVARYGGEEFVMLCADCDNATAARRAEQIRMTLAQTPQHRLEGRPVTASFGVTEIQPGDSPETMLRRADRALLMAKAKGRNRVVQLGSGSSVDQIPRKRGGQTGKVGERSDTVIRQNLITPVPITMAIEKLRGFVADHQAKIISIDGNIVELEIAGEQRPARRRNDRPVNFRVELRFEEQQYEKSWTNGPGPATVSRTKIEATITPRKNRDRRRADANHRACEVLTSLRSYLMATSEKESVSGKGVLRRAKRALAPWFTKP